jgi:hypothetical protein
MQSAFSGLNNSMDVRKAYGLSDPDFSPFKKQLGVNRDVATQRAIGLAGRSATPGMTASGIETAYAGQLQNLLGQEGQAKTGMDQFVANLLQGAKGSQDQFGLSQMGMMGNMDNAMIQQWLQKMGLDLSNQSPDALAYIGTLLGGASAPLSALIGKP